MGKKNKAKKSNSLNADLSSSVEDYEVQNVSKPNTNNIKNNNIGGANNKLANGSNKSETQDTDLENNTDQIKKKNRKRNLSHDERKTKKNSCVEEKKKTKVETKMINKKNIFDEEVDPETSTLSKSSITTKIANKKNKKLFNEDEAEVMDEDIDKFCDEVTEEDNAHYEDWVKLVEAKLRANVKKKSV